MAVNSTEGEGITRDSFLSWVSISHEHTKHTFGGVLSREEIYLIKDPIGKFYIVNTLDRNSSEAVGHWLLFFFMKPPMLPVFFDSLGKEMEDYYPPMAEWLVQPYETRDYLTNIDAVQSKTSTFCGYYTLYMADMLSQGYGFNHAMGVFHPSKLSLNDWLMKSFVNGHMINAPYSHRQRSRASATTRAPQIAYKRARLGATSNKKTLGLSHSKRRIHHLINSREANRRRSYQ